jgi:uncharacterized protein YgbK (DUF1537 family)
MSAAESSGAKGFVLPVSSLAALPKPRHALAEVKRLLAAAPRKIVVLDDDPTGTQTVHGIDVLTEWTEPALAAALADPSPCCFVLTNSRSLPEAEAVALARTIAANLRAAGAASGRPYTVISRSDSTLRGHFPAELDVLAEAEPGAYDAMVIAPAFFEAGRLSIDDVHYVREGDELIPAGETEFARDATFGYRSSNLREWVEEKTRGAVAARDVVSIPLTLLRDESGATQVRDRLLSVPKGGCVVVNAAEYGDLEVFVHGLLLAEATGRRYLCRTAASFVRVRAGVEPQPLLEAEALRGHEGHGGLVIVGSYTAKTTAQLELARALPNVVTLELDVGRLIDAKSEAAELSRLTPHLEALINEGRTAIVFTSRARETALGRAGDLKAGRTVSDALVKLVRGLQVRPAFLIAKGGITSSDIAVRGLDVRRALILGQAAPGIPVWRTGPESRWPGLAYIVFPGNVGEKATLQTLLAKLAG